MPAKLTQSEFIKRSANIHEGKYDYSLVEYIGQFNPVTIICPEHSEFQQAPASHQHGKGCQKCARELVGKKNAVTYTKDTEFFITKARDSHGDRYDYSKVEYSNMKTAVTIICPTHGEFSQNPHTHTVIKSGCPKCASAGRSRLQDDWLDTLEDGKVAITRNARVYFEDGSWLRPDGVKDNTFYEFWGDWAHGNPKFYSSDEINTRFKKSFGQLYEETLIKRQKILDNGYKLVEIWEHEWKQR